MIPRTAGRARVESLPTPVPRLPHEGDVARAAVRPPAPVAEARVKPAAQAGDRPWPAGRGRAGETGPRGRPAGGR